MSNKTDQEIISDNCVTIHFNTNEESEKYFKAFRGVKGAKVITKSNPAEIIFQKDKEIDQWKGMYDVISRREQEKDERIKELEKDLKWALDSITGGAYLNPISGEFYDKDKANDLKEKYGRQDDN